MVFSGWTGSLKHDRYHTFTPESADERAAELAEAGFTAVIVNGYHFRLGFLDRDDDLRRTMRLITEACHRHGLKVIEHVDLTILFYDGYPQAFEHPDWLQLSAADMLTRHRIYCLNNPDFQEFYLDYFRRFQRETDVDAYQMDEITWLSRAYCGCRHCRAKYKRASGRDYPPTHDPAFWERAHTDPEYRAWMRWRMRALNDFRQLVADELRKIRPDLKMFTYTTTQQSNPYCFARSSCLESRIQPCDTVGTEVNAVPFLSYPSVYANLKCRTALSEATGKAAWAKLEFTPQSAYFAWCFGRLARQSLWFSLSPQSEDPSPKRLFAWPYQMDDGAATVDADVAILLSTSTRDLRRDYEFYHHEFEGWLEALLLNHHEVKVILEIELATQRAELARHRLVILPNVAALSGEQGEALLDYVRAGGKLLLTADAGTLDLEGEPLVKPFLAEAGISIVDAGEGKTAIELAPAGEYELSYRAVELAEGTERVAGMTVNGRDLPLLARRALGEGQFWYLAAKLGPLAHEPHQMSTSRYKRGYQPPPDARALDLIGAVAELILADVPHSRLEGAPRGLLTGLYRTEREGRTCRVLHLLNASGRDLKPGDPIAFARKQPLPMPALPEMQVRLPGPVSEAILASPELAEPVQLSVRREGEPSVISVPAEAFATYGVIWAYD